MHKKKIVLVVTFCLLKSVAMSTTANESIAPFLVFSGAPSGLSVQSIPILAEYDLLIMGTGHHHKVNGNTWAAIKAVSPDTKIFLYQTGPYVADNNDAVPTAALNNLGRFNVSRGSSQGSINGDHPDWFLKNSAGQRVGNIRSSHLFALDFGNKDFAAYWSKHTLEDIVFQTWRADGIFIDEVGVCNDWSLKSKPSYVPVKYSNCQSWNKAMSDYLVQVSTVLHQNNQQVMVNLGATHQEASVPEAWQALSQRSSAPDIMLEEGAFAVAWDNGVVRYWPVKNWQQQIDLPARVNRQVALNSSTDLMPGQQGVAATGEAVSHSQIMRFATGSYLLARNANGLTTYFRFADDMGSVSGPNRLKSAERYSEFDVGVPVEPYQKKLPDQDLFYRKYTRGYVYVNPGNKIITTIKAESDAEFSTSYSNSRQVGSDWYFDLPPHDAAIIKVKEGSTGSSKQTTPPPVPPVLQAN